MGGKADWLANGLPREGAAATVPYAGDVVDRSPPTCGLTTPIAEVRTALDDSGYGFCLVVNDVFHRANAERQFHPSAAQ